MAGEVSLDSHHNFSSSEHCGLRGSFSSGFSDGEKGGGQDVQGVEDDRGLGRGGYRREGRTEDLDRWGQPSP